MKKFDRQLWKQFLAITLPYWYPVSRGGGRNFLGLLLLLLVFLFTVFFVAISAVSLVGQHYFPELSSSLVPGLAESATNIINSPAIYVVGLCLITPIIGFFYYRNQLRDRWLPWALLALVVLLLLSGSALNVISTYVSRDIINALAEQNSPRTFRLVFVYGSVFAVATPLVVFSRYFTKKLGLYWHGWLTNYFLDKYFQNRAYYQINSNADIDNPDQRISEDIRSFTVTSLELLLMIFNQVVDLIAFSGILWSISKTLVAVLVVYAIFGNIVTVWFGKHMIGINIDQRRCEADFRYGLIHIRNNAESIAFSRGEDKESSLVRQRFYGVLRNFNLLIGWQRNLEFFTQGYQYFVLILPYLVVVPLYFDGQIELGVIPQTGIAFNQVLGSLSIIVRQFSSLTAFAAEINRLGTFADALETPRARSRDRQNARTIDTVEDFHLALEHITLQTPNYEQILVKDLSVSFEAGEGLLIVGESGCGKSSLLRAIAGLWNTGTGRLVRPNLEEMLFLPQRPYMILGSLRDQLLYPNTSRELTDKELYQVLEQVNLQNLPARVGGLDAELDWDDVLSLGEQQRIAFARLLLTRPRYAILDEATSALDLKNEEHLYQQLQKTETTFISVGHRSSLFKYHHLVLELLGDSSWRLAPTQKYRTDASLFA